MDPFEKTITDFLKKRKEVAQSIVNGRVKLTDKEDPRLPFNIYKTSKHIEEFTKKRLKPVTHIID